MNPQRIIEILLEKVRTCNAPIGRQVSFTISDLPRQGDVEKKIMQFFMQTYGAVITIGGKKNERHFSFILQQEMFNYIEVRLESLPRITHFSHRPNRDFVH